MKGDFHFFQISVQAAMNGKFWELSVIINKWEFYLQTIYCNTIIEVFTNPPKIMGLDMYLKGTKTFGIYPRGQYKPPFERTFEFQSLLNNHDMENAPIDYDTSW